jgi:hypothetical protein
MALIAFKGASEAVNQRLLLYAAEHAPSLIIDCANCANPHALPFFDGVFVVQSEMLYKFRDTLKHFSAIVRSLVINCVVITTFDRLFNYGNDEENIAVFEHIWELIPCLGYDVFIGICAGSIHEDFARKHSGKIVEVT